MFVHSVYFWLKPDLNEEQKSIFWKNVKALKGIESLKHCWIGTPASTDRPVIDRSYSCALTTVFEDETGHDQYQVHPLHEIFKVECSGLWSKILIYDNEE